MKNALSAQNAILGATGARKNSSSRAPLRSHLGSKKQHSRARNTHFRPKSAPRDARRHPPAREIHTFVPRTLPQRQSPRSRKTHVRPTARAHSTKASSSKNVFKKTHGYTAPRCALQKTSSKKLTGARHQGDFFSSRVHSTKVSYLKNVFQKAHGYKKVFQKVHGCTAPR